MITYEKYLERGGKLSQVAFWDLKDKYLRLRQCATMVARYKERMRHSGQRDSVEELAYAARELSYYFSDCDGVQKIALWGIREIAELNATRTVREELNKGRAIKYLFCY